MSNVITEAGMEEDSGQWCILLPCSQQERWAVPQNTLAEIVTVNGEQDQPPEAVTWRGESVPVLDLGNDDDSHWRESAGGTGLVAVFLGLEGERCKYWGVVLRGEGLAVKRVASSGITDAPEEAAAHASAAFKLEDKIYQVPDLAALQQQIAASTDAA